MNTTLLAFILATFAGFATMIGTIPIFFRHLQEEKILTIALSFASGVMIAVSFTDLIPESLTLFHHTYTSTFSMLLMSTFAVLGIICSMLIDKYLPNQSTHNHKQLYRVGLFAMIAIILHNIPEGIATFMASSSNTKLGISLAIAIALHNIPEGISISIPIYYATKKKKTALGYTFLSGISEPFGALLAFLFLSPFMSDTVMAMLFAMIAGIMIHIAIYELAPTAWRYQKRKLFCCSFAFGVLFMLINHFCF